MAPDQIPLEWNFEGVGPNGYAEGGIPAFEVFNQQVDLNPLEVLVREAIQNSCDAKLADSDQPVRVEFHLRELEDDKSSDFLKNAGIEGTSSKHLFPHLVGTAGQEGTLQDRIEADGISQIESKRLRVMTVSDSGTQGLWGDEGVQQGSEGPIRGNFHRLVRAAMETHEESGSLKGGSFGLGKAIYWMTSGLSTAILYSIPSSDPNAMVPRLIGRSWLPSHTSVSKDGTYEQWNNVGGWFGVPDQSEHGLARSISLWGEEASEHAKLLGLQRNPEDTGTSIAIIGFDDPDKDDEPTVEETCRLLDQHVRTWYWPALCSGKLTVGIKGETEGRTVFDSDLQELSEDDPVVGPFVTAWFAIHEGRKDGLLADGSQFLSQVEPWGIPERSKEPHHPTTEASVRLGLLVRENETLDDVRHRNSIALMRGSTGMVVDYFAPDGANHLFGNAGKVGFGVALTGLANSSGDSDHRLEQFLRAAEPPAHDCWSQQQERVRRAYRWKGAGGLTAKQAISSYYDSVRQFMLQAIDQPVPDGSRGPDRLARLLTFGARGEQAPPNPKLIVRAGEVSAEPPTWTFSNASFGLNSDSNWSREGQEWSFDLYACIPEEGGGGLRRLQTLEILRLSVPESDGEVPSFTPGDSRVRIVASPGIERVHFDVEIRLPESLSDPSRRTSRVGAQLSADLLLKDGAHG